MQMTDSEAIKIVKDMKNDILDNEKKLNEAIEKMIEYERNKK